MVVENKREERNRWTPLPCTQRSRRLSNDDCNFLIQLLELRLYEINTKRFLYLSDQDGSFYTHLFLIMK